jgi:hypothetical protein
MNGYPAACECAVCLYNCGIFEPKRKVHSPGTYRGFRFALILKAVYCMLKFYAHKQ